MVISSLGAGGAERQFFTTATGLARRDVELRVVVEDVTQETGGSFFVDSLGSADIPLVAARMRLPPRRHLQGSRHEHLVDLLDALPGSESRRIAGFLGVFERERPDVVHAWQDATGVVAALAAVVCGIPRVVISTRSMAPDRKTGRNRVYLRQCYRELLRLPQVTLVNNSLEGAADYRRWLDMPDLPVDVVVNGFDFDAFDGLADPARTRAIADELRLGEAEAVIGGVLRLTEEKRPHLWLETALTLLAERPRCRFVLIGDGPIRGDLEARVAGAGLGDRIHIVGHRKDIHSWYPLFDVLLLTSRIEGTPNVLIEAQAHGVPVVTTNAGGARHAIEDGVTGRLVATASPQALTAAIATYLDVPGDKRNRAQACRRFVRDRFGIDPMIDRTMALLFPS